MGTNMFSGKSGLSVLKQLTCKMGIYNNVAKRKLVTLPKLPVPPLRQTLEKYLLSVRPLLNEKEFIKTEKIVQAFGGTLGIGEKLHAMLNDRSKNQANWLSDWWLQCAYLEFREPLIAYSSPGLIMPEQRFVSSEDQLKFASKLINASVKFKSLIDSNELPQETAGGAPLDMSQYSKIFGTCRIPNLPRDELLHNPDSKHIIVAHKNQFFKLDVYDKMGTPLNESEIFRQLKSVVTNTQDERDPIGILTSEHRDLWAKAYKRLCQQQENKESVDVIQKAIFLVCLDKAVPKANSENYLTHSAQQNIHGGGRKNNSGNRWYDKTIQFVIAEDGCLGLTYEHSPAEGPPITRLVDFVMEYVEKNIDNKWSTDPVAKPCLPLPFKISAETSSDIEEADKDLNSLINDLNMNCFKFNPFGKDFIKSQKLSPDSVIQMALQLAFYRLNGFLGATYESASTRKFHLGRTETIRSASLEALQFCQAMQNSSLKPVKKAETLRQAVASHKAYTSGASDGLGVDRFFLGLKLLAIENGITLPDLFSDPGFKTSSHFRLSTSQVPARCESLMGYGPAVPDGYGCCYNPQTASINFAVSAWKSSPSTNATKFGDAVQQGLIDIHDVLLAAQTSKL